jgi:hypothetical protein
MSIVLSVGSSPSHRQPDHERIHSMPIVNYGNGPWLRGSTTVIKHKMDMMCPGLM